MNEIFSLAKKYGAEVVAVSKLQSEEKIRRLHQEGSLIFAENYVQEALLKIENLKALNDIRWHFIGGLQTNKVKMIMGKFELIHSVDSVELAQKIDRRAQEFGVPQKILMQLNLAEEATKGGFLEADYQDTFEQLAKMKGIEVCGLMTMPPLLESSELVRPIFKKLRHLAERNSLKVLSMGTSADYSVALEEGATLIRIGTILFGARPTKK